MPPLFFGRESRVGVVAGRAAAHTISPMDEQFMRRALELAAKGRYSVSPNPMVGCVVVRNGEIIGEGFHQRTGMAHAEVEALRSCRVTAMGATAYTTLEPCNHTGRTPPCTEVLIAAGVERVVAALEDPHPLVQGRGIAALRAAGIDVSVGLLSEQAAHLNEKFLYSARTRRPFVLLKAGMTLDGKLATVHGQSQWITSTEARDRSLALREEYDAILVGSGTVLADDPQLTRRLGWNSAINPWLRVAVDSRGEIPPNARILNDGGRTLIITSQPERYAAGEAVEILPMDARDGRLDLEAVLATLAERGVQSVIVEGGSALISDVLQRRLWQKMSLFVAPMVVGGTAAPSIFQNDGIADLSEALRFRFDSAESVGNDLLITAYPN